MSAEFVLDAWELIDSEIPAEADWLSLHFALLITNACDQSNPLTVKLYPLPYCMSHNQHVVAHSRPINLNLGGDKFLFQQILLG